MQKAKTKAKPVKSPSSNGDKSAKPVKRALTPAERELKGKPILDDTEAKTKVTKVSDKELSQLSGRLVKIKRIMATPVFVPCLKGETIDQVLAKIKLEASEKNKIEALPVGAKKYVKVEDTAEAIQFTEICLTTKVRGSY